MDSEPGHAARLAASHSAAAARFVREQSESSERHSARPVERLQVEVPATRAAGRPWTKAVRVLLVGVARDSAGAARLAAFRSAAAARFLRETIGIIGAAFCTTRRNSFESEVPATTAAVCREPRP